MPTPLPLSQVYAVQVKRRSTGLGIVTGGVGGGGMMFARGMAGVCPKEPTCYSVGEVALTAAGGLAISALAGGLLGHALSTWHTVVDKSPPRKRPPNPLRR